MANPFVASGLFMMDALFTVTLVVLVVYATRNYLLGFGALLYRENKAEDLDEMSEEMLPTFSILVPMHNEEIVAERTLTSMLNIDYPKEKYEVIPINDASSDNTGQILDTLGLQHPNMIKPIHRADAEKRGKSGALNSGLAVATGELIAIFDGDHSADSSVLRWFAYRFWKDADSLCAVQGRTKYLNENENFVTKLVTRERDPGLAVYLRGEGALKMTPFMAGSSVAIKRELFDNIGLFDESSLTDDTDLSMRAYLTGYNVAVEPRAFSREEAVKTVKQMLVRSHRWARGHNRVAFTYWKDVLQSRFLSTAQKAWTITFLGFYTVPLIVALGIGLYALSIFFPLRPFFIEWTTARWVIFSVGYFLYTGLSHFIMLSIGLVLVGRRLRDSLIYLVGPLLSPLNIVVCLKAFIDEMMNKRSVWMKTPRSGYVGTEGYVQTTAPERIPR